MGRCAPDAVGSLAQNILRSYEKFPELVQLYRSKGAHRQALELLASLGQSTNRVGPIMKMAGTEETVKYLQVRRALAAVAAADGPPIDAPPRAVAVRARASV